MIGLDVRNTGPQEPIIASVIVNDGVMPFEVTPSANIPRLGAATTLVEYPRSHEEAYGITIFTSNAIAFN